VFQASFKKNPKWILSYEHSGVPKSKLGDRGKDLSTEKNLGWIFIRGAYLSAKALPKGLFAVKYRQEGI